MKKVKMSQFKIFLSISLLVIVVAVSAFSGILKKDHPQSGFIHKKHDGGGAIQLSTSLDNDYYFDNNNVYLLVDIKADKVEPVRERTPMNVAIVIDRSGSMDEKNKLTYVKKAVNYIIDSLEAMIMFQSLHTIIMLMFCNLQLELMINMTSGRRSQT